MFVELCLILRITLHEASHHYRVEGFNSIPCDATKEPPHDLQKTTMKEIKDLPLKEIPDNRNLGIEKDLLSEKMWLNNPLNEHSRAIQHNLNHVNLLNDDNKPLILRHPQTLTKLAKTLTYGFEPYFSKGSFEPFETRPKPITLVAFRKNGLAPRESMKQDKLSSAETAELQSPFNTINSFWSDTGYNS